MGHLCLWMSALDEDLTAPALVVIPSRNCRVIKFEDSSAVIAGAEPASRSRPSGFIRTEFCHAVYAPFCAVRMCSVRGMCTRGGLCAQRDSGDSHTNRGTSRKRSE